MAPNSCIHIGFGKLGEETRVKFRFRKTLIKSLGRAKQVSRLRRIARAAGQSCCARNDSFLGTRLNDKLGVNRSLLGTVLVVLMTFQAGVSAIAQEPDA